MGIFSFPGLLLLLIPSSFPILIIMIFKYNISFLIIGFCIFEPGMYYSFIKTFKDEINIQTINKVLGSPEGEINNSFSTDD